MNLTVPLPGDLVRVWPDARRYRLADVYWRGARSVVLTSVDGRVVYTSLSRVLVVEPRAEAST